MSYFSLFSVVIEGLPFGSAIGKQGDLDPVIYLPELYCPDL